MSTITIPVATFDAMREALESADSFIDGLRQDLHSQRVGDWYPEGAHNAASDMSESMRLIGNRCADFNDVEVALTAAKAVQPQDFSDQATVGAT